MESEFVGTVQIFLFPSSYSSFKKLSVIVPLNVDIDQGSDGLISPTTVELVS